MRKTENLGLNLLDYSDQLSPKPLNENAAMLDAFLKTMNGTLTSQGESLTEQGESLTEQGETLDGLTTSVGQRVKMARGSYAGNGSLSCSISTPGIVPAALLIRERKDPYTYSGIGTFDVSFAEQSFTARGFVLWNGNAVKTAYWYESGELMNPTTGSVQPTYITVAANINFTASEGKLEWTLKTDTDKPPAEGIGNAHLVNNQTGVTYEWVAFGFEEVGS